MAKKQSMTFEEALQVILSSEGDNPLRQMLELAAQGGARGRDERAPKQ